MRHNVYGKHLGRDKNQRTALFRGLIRALVLEGFIVTTEAKVKAVKGLVDKLFAKAKKGDIASQNVITKAIPQKEISTKIMELAKKIKNQNSGFTTTVRLGVRPGDGAMMMKMSLVNQSSAVSSQASDKKEELESNEEIKEVESKEEIKVEKKEKAEKKPTKKESKK